MRLVEGLLVAHLLIAIAFLLGSNAVSWDRRQAASAADAMVRIVCTCALGFAFLGFGAFLVALVGLFSPVGVATMTAAIFAASCAWARQSPFRREYWTERARSVYDGIDAAHVIVYFAMLVVAFPAVNLANAGADALAFHWSYALDLVRAGSLTVDPFLREPFYAQNDLMLVATVLLFGGGVVVQFVMWAFGMLTALGVCAAARDAFDDRGLWAGAIGILLACAVTYNPSYLRWMDSGYLDVALGFFALASVLAMRRALRDGSPDWRWLGVAAVTAAFLIGSKTSLLPFSIVFALLFAIAARRLGCSRAQIAFIVATLLVLAAPWYARNLMLAGDPIAPWLNLRLHGTDGLVTASEWQRIADDLATDKSPLWLATIPYRIFATPDTLPFREFATNALMLLLFVPTLTIFVLSIVLHRKVSASVAFPVAALTLFVLYWLFSSTIARYALIFLPTLGVCCALAAASLGLSLRRFGPAFAAIFALACVISPTAEARTFYSTFFVNGVQNTPIYYTSDEPFLRVLVDGYSEERYIARTMHRLAVPGRLYLLGTNVSYYYKKDGIESIGDWIGPAGAFRLYRAVGTGQEIAYFDDLGVNAVLLDPHRAVAGLEVPIGRRLVRAGFCAIPLPESRMTFFVRTTQDCATARRLAAR